MIINYIDDIPKDLTDKVEFYIRSAEFPWFYQPHSILPEQVSDDNLVSDEFIVHDHPIFQSLMYWQHQSRAWYGVVEELSNYLIGYFANNVVYERLVLGRVLANMTFPKRTAEGRIQQPHTDCVRGDPYYSFLYYPMTSDGDTYFFDNKLKHGNELFAKSSPIKGTGVLFNSDVVHAGSLPIYSERRIAINFMFQRLII